MAEAVFHLVKTRTLTSMATEKYSVQHADKNNTPYNCKNITPSIALHKNYTLWSDATFSTLILLNSSAIKSKL